MKMKQRKNKTFKEHRHLFLSDLNISAVTDLFL